VSGHGAQGNICVLLGLAAFAGWTLSRFTVPRRLAWVNLVGGVGMLALLFSIVSPDDDGLQQELIRPATPSVRVSAHTKGAPQRSPVDSSINTFIEAEDPIHVPRTGRAPVRNQPLVLGTHFHAPTPIHFPPAL